MDAPKRKTEVIISELKSAEGWYFDVVCDKDLTDSIRELEGVNHVWHKAGNMYGVGIDKRYEASEILAYVSAKITEIAKDRSLSRKLDDVLNNIKDDPNGTD